MLGVLHRYVPNQGTAWQVTLDQLSKYFERVAALSLEQPPSPPPRRRLSDAQDEHSGSNVWDEMIGSSRHMTCLLGQRTAELHRMLAGNHTDPAFAREPLGKLYQRSMYQSMRNITGRLCDHLSGALDILPESVRPLAKEIVRRRDSILNRFRAVLDSSLSSLRIRCHGDYHLAQLLYTGKDFVVIDFEGDTNRPIGGRRMKRSPLRDVASMIRSFDYAAQSVLLGVTNSHGTPPGMIRPRTKPPSNLGRPPGTSRSLATSSEPISTRPRMTGFCPRPTKLRIDLLELLILEKVLAEVDAELEHRPEWVIIPLRSVIRLLATDPDDPAFLS